MERNLLDTLHETLDAAEEGEESRAAGELVRLVTDCQERHTELHQELLGARDVFLAEQERQRFRPAAPVRAIAIEDELLRPLLALALPAAAPAATEFLVRSAGAVAPRIGRLSDLVAMLLRPPREVEEAPPDEAPDLVEGDVDAHRFPEEVRRSAELVLAAVDGGPVRLSALLAAARRTGEPVAELVALTALRAFAPEAETETLIARDDGEELEDLRIGGRDLLLARAGEEDG